MKKLFLIPFISLSLYASNEETTNITPLELFLFKIGYTSLVSDFENEKNKTIANRYDINKLKLSIDNIMKNKENNKNNRSNLLVIKNDNDQNKELKKEIENLKSEINILKSYVINTSKKEKLKPIVIKKHPSSYMRVAGKGIYIRKTPSIKGKVIRVATHNEYVNIEFCNSHDWCKIKDKEEYIAKYLLK